MSGPSSNDDRPADVTLRPVSDSDNEFLFSVYADSREQELAQTEWDESQKQAFLRWQFDLQRREYEGRYPAALYEIIIVNDQPAGRLWTGEDETQIRLLDISLLKQFQNRSVGTLLLHQLIRRAVEAKKPLRHMVFLLNADAYRFYERLGFVTIEDVGAYKHMEWNGERSEEANLKTD